MGSKGHPRSSLLGSTWMRSKQCGAIPFRRLVRLHTVIFLVVCVCIVVTKTQLFTSHSWSISPQAWWGPAPAVVSRPVVAIGGVESHAKACRDSTRLMPSCNECIPGLFDGTGGGRRSGCSSLHSDVTELRDTIGNLAEERYGNRHFELYPYLSSPALVQRQIDVGKMLAEDRPRSILDIGPYTNPIWEFFPPGYCPELVVAVEPCGELATKSSEAWRSVFVPCPGTKGSTTSEQTHIIVAPFTAQLYLQSAHFRNTKFDAVVCIGCDGHFGPRPEQLATIPRPFYLYVEYPQAYTPSVQAFQISSIRNNICGPSLKATRTREYINDPRDIGADDIATPYVTHRMLASYNCTTFVGVMPSGYKVECWPSTKNYQGMACMAEAHSFLSVRDEAFLPTIVNNATTARLQAAAKKRHNTCTLCTHVLDAYKLRDRRGVRTPFNATDARAMTNITAYWPAKRPDLDDLPSKSGPLRINDAKYMMDYARAVFRQGSSNGSAWDALAAATVARRLLHAGGPGELLAAPGGLLHDAVIEYNEYLAAIIETAPQEYPSEYTYALRECPGHLDNSYSHLAVHQLETILPDLRNLGFHELNILIDMSPYRVLASFPEVASRRYRRKILIDIGTNGFYGSAKHLLDMYAPFMQFDEVHLIEPDLAGMEIPEFYRQSYNISFHRKKIKVGTRDEDDILTFLQQHTVPEDFVVLKFDVDENVRGLTMEWGFLADLVHAKELRLVDELFIELHFYYKGFKNGMMWQYDAHSMEQAYDVMRQLRRCGLPIHAWP